MPNPNIDTSDNGRASLFAGITAVALSFILFDNPSPPDSGIDDYAKMPTGPSSNPVFVLTIEDEQILCFSRSTTSVVVYEEDVHALGILSAGQDGRGWAGTTPATHNANVIVFANVVSTIPEWIQIRNQDDEDNLAANYYTSAEIDAILASRNTKDEVEVATTGNITLSGDGQTIDGLTPAAGQRVLVKDQSDQRQNGIYTVAVGAWSRSSDADTTEELDAALVPVKAGTSNANSLWLQTTNDPNIGVDNIIWSQIGATLDKASQGEAEAGTDNAKYMTPLRTRQSIEKAPLFASGVDVRFNNGVVLGTGSLSALSKLDINSTTRGIRIPRLTTLQMDTIPSPPDGLLIYDIDIEHMMEYDGAEAEWRAVGSRRSVGTETLSATAAALAITGLGFRPRLIKVTAVSAPVAGAFCTSWGHATGSGDDDCIYMTSQGASTPQGAAFAGILRSQATGTANNWSGVVTTLDDDGFTLNITKSGTPSTLFLHWEAWE